ncbi:hypothetical protein ES703_36862 [subsurface metagenome]
MFIPEARKKQNVETPDLCGRCGGSIVLLEVKTINRSKEEIDVINVNSRRSAVCMQVIQVQLGVSDSLKRKITDKINKAREQLTNYAYDGVQRRIVFLKIHLDISARDSRNIAALRAYVDKQSDKQVEVVCVIESQRGA